MKQTIIAAILVLVSSFSLIAGGIPSLTANEHVKYEVAMKEQSLKASSTGTLLISLHPKKGVHISLKPQINITIDSSYDVAKIVLLTIPGSDTILNVSKPIRLPVTLSDRVKPGKIAIKGTIIYYYCSEVEGWCSRFKQPFEFAINVVK